MPWPLRLFEILLFAGFGLWIGWWMADKQWRYTALGVEEPLSARFALVFAWGSTVSWLSAVVILALYGPEWVAAMWPVWP